MLGRLLDGVNHRAGCFLTDIQQGPRLSEARSAAQQGKVRR
jgi:hypothetical protein